MLINQTIARSGYLGPHPVGTEIYAAGPSPWRIVGVVEDTRQGGLDQEPGPEIFISFKQYPAPSGRVPPTSPYFVVRTVMNPVSVVPAIRSVVASADAQASLDRVATMEQIVSNTLVRPRFFTTLLGAFAVVAVSLALTGIYGVLSFMVRQRGREIGIRMSLGATRSAILRLVLGQGMLLAGAGVALGLGASALVTRSLTGLLFGIAPLDLPTYVAVALSFGCVSCLASYIPARHATLVDPVAALRCE
jgi:putative ABC transport system permease protein